MGLVESYLRYHQVVFFFASIDFEFKDNCNNFRRVWPHFQSEVILIQVYYDKVNKIECFFCFIKNIVQQLWSEKRN